MKNLGSVAVIGAGLSGLSCAQALQASGVKVRVFERGPAVGGRCATQLWQGHLVDTGVQYFTAQSGDFKKELLTRLRQFRPIISPILDQNNQPVASAFGPRFYVLQGNNYFAHVLSSGLEIRYNTEIGPLTFKAPGVKVGDENFDAVVSSVPGPQTVRLFGLRTAPAEFEPALIALLEYGGTDVGLAREAYAHVLADASGVLRASYCENNKVGRIVGNKTVFILEATTRYSRENSEKPPEKYLPELIKRHEEIWSIPVNRLSASYGMTWKFGRPRQPAPAKLDLPPGAFICGDSRCESSVESVWVDGQKAAKEVVKFLTKL